MRLGHFYDRYVLRHPQGPHHRLGRFLLARCPLLRSRHQRLPLWHPRHRALPVQDRRCPLRHLGRLDWPDCFRLLLLLHFFTQYEAFAIVYEDKYGRQILPVGKRNLFTPKAPKAPEASEISEMDAESITAPIVVGDDDVVEVDGDVSGEDMV